MLRKKTKYNETKRVNFWIDPRNYHDRAHGLHGELVYHNPDFKSNDVVGYAAMVVVFSLTFFGIRNYRNKQLNGVISLGNAFKTGALIALIGSSVYVGVWLFYYYLFVPDFLDKYTLHALKEATRSGATASELAAKTREMDQFREMY